MLPLYELVEAIKWDRGEDVRAALDCGADPNGRDLGQLSMLQLAEKHHANKVVPDLVRAGADLYERIGAKDDSLLHIAARHENVGFAHALLEAGMSANLVNASGELPLHIAARTGQTYLAKTLVKHQSRVLHRDSRGRTAIDLAKSAEKSEMLRLLEPLVAEAAHQARMGQWPSPREHDLKHEDPMTVPTKLQAVGESQSDRSNQLRYVDRVRAESRTGYALGGRN